MIEEPHEAVPRGVADRGVGAPRDGGEPPSVSSRDLLAGTRELLIRHGQDTYRLRVTGSNKLILTK